MTKDSLRITREGLNCQFSSFRIRSSVIRLILFSITRDVHFVGNSLDKSNLYYYYILVFRVIAFVPFVFGC